jgi:hypothetical protein
LEWTHYKIAELAPNSLTLGKAKALAHTRHWAEAASNGGLLWGLCKTSGERVYRVALSLSGDAFRCECAASCHPCRHALALLLQFVKTSKPSIALSESPPPWVQEMLRQRPAVTALSADEKAQKEAARTARFGQRLALMQQGVEDLEQWLLDLLRQGLSSAESQPDAFWENFAVRMTDAKLSGLARRIRGFKAIVGTDQWHSLLLGELASLYLLVQSFKQWPELPEQLQEEIFNQAGVSRKKEELLLLKGLADTWLVIGQVEGESEEDKLRYRRTWLLGEQSQRLALMLDFSWGRQGYETNWASGSAIRGEAIFYPGAYPLRALIRKAVPYNYAFHAPAGYLTLSDFAQAYAQALAANPWLTIFPCLLAQVVPLHQGGTFWVVDQEQHMLPLSADGDAAWKLLGLSSGQPLKLFGEWDGKALRPVSALLEQRLVSLQAPLAQELDLTGF